MNISLPASWHRFLYVFGLSLTAAGLPLSKFMISVSVFWVGINWLWEGDFAAKWRRFKMRPAIAVLMAVFAIHLIGLLWTSDAGAGWRDIRVKIPLLLFPLLLGTTPQLSRKEFVWVIGIFLAAVFVSTLSTLIIAAGWWSSEINDLRKASKFVSLIRLSLMADLAIFWLGRILFRPVVMWQKAAAVAGIALLIFFLIYMQSLTGLVVLAIGGFILALMFLILRRKRKAALVVTAVFAAGAIFAGTEMYSAWKIFTPDAAKTAADSKLEKFTTRGNFYTHEVADPMIENGRYVNRWICWIELDSAWNSRSSIKLNGGKTAQGVAIHIVLIRYMTSKGLRKDADGIQQLTADDIQKIESGLCNAEWPNMNQLQRRMYQVYWELHVYGHGGDPSGKSVTMRFELAQTALACISEAPVVGHGTGSTEKTMRNWYSNNGTSLGESFQWMHPHNQFLSVALTLGIPALLYFIFSLLYPMSKMGRWKNYISVAFFIIAVTSFLNDDTLETQQGVTFFAYFNALVLFALPLGSNREVAK
ncbi:MAG: O-antigen ligase family protein [Bacteroidota bacterium]